jgi:hypothetical protein
MDDGGMKVEILRGAAGAVVAARMCATNDVDEVGGVWRNAGELDIASGRCLAADPYCSAKDAHRFEFDVSPGRYVAEVFDFTSDDEGTIAWRCASASRDSGAGRFPVSRPPRAGLLIASAPLA